MYSGTGLQLLDLVECIITVGLRKLEAPCALVLSDALRGMVDIGQAY